MKEQLKRKKNVSIKLYWIVNFELEDETEDHGRNSVKKIKQNMISNKKMKINDLFTVEKH